jgi:hypothetical protein
LRWCALLSVLPFFASCNDGWDCGDSCGPGWSPEVSVGLVAADFQKVGHASIVATSTVLRSPYGNPGSLKLYPLTGGAAPTITPDGNDPLYLASGDLNGDGVPDVVSASFTDGVLAVFLNSSSAPGTFGQPLVLPSPGASQVAIADMNGDGLPDLVSADYNVSLFLQSSPGSFASPIPLYPGGANWVALGDLNGDGAKDVALTDAFGVKVLMHAPPSSASPESAAFLTPVQVYTESSPTSVLGANIIAIADVNGDGLNDLVITDPGPDAGSAPFVAVLLQNPAAKGTFLPPVPYPIQPFSAATSILVADVNGDGLPDIVVGGTAGVTVLLQAAGSPGTFMTAATYKALNANEIAIADTNGDGFVDIVVGSGVPSTPVAGVLQNTPGVLLQNGSAPGTFGALQNVP